jgi:hypothetical protein
MQKFARAQGSEKLAAPAHCAAARDDPRKGAVNNGCPKQNYCMPKRYNTVSHLPGPRAQGFRLKKKERKLGHFQIISFISVIALSAFIFALRVFILILILFMNGT